MEMFEDCKKLGDFKTGDEVWIRDPYLGHDNLVQVRIGQVYPEYSLYVEIEYLDETGGFDDIYKSTPCWTSDWSKKLNEQ